MTHGVICLPQCVVELPHAFTLGRELRLQPAAVGVELFAVLTRGFVLLPFFVAAVALDEKLLALDFEALTIGAELVPLGLEALAFSHPIGFSALPFRLAFRLDP